MASPIDGLRERGDRGGTEEKVGVTKGPVLFAAGTSGGSPTAERNSSGGSFGEVEGGEGRRRHEVVAHSRTFTELQPVGVVSWQECWHSTRMYFSFDVAAIPIVQWLPKYNRYLFLQDLIAGLSVGVLLIPQSMAYALLAGLPPIYGMYASTVPLFVYALLASSTKLSPGPVAPVSILVNELVTGILAAGSAGDGVAERVRVTIALGFVSGVVLVLAGILRLGFIANLLSWPVMSGFVAGAGVIIVTSQLKEFFGLTYVSESNDFVTTLGYVFSNLHTANGITSAIALVSFVFLVGVKYLHKCYLWPCSRNKSPPPRWMPVQLMVVIICVLISWGFRLDETMGVRVVGEIPAGFPPASFAISSGSEFLSLLSPAATLALVAYVGAISLAVAFAREEQEEVSSSVELVAQGMAALVGSFFAGYTVSGSFTRTAVNATLGAKTPMAVVFTGLLMLLVLMAAAPLFTKLPNAALSAMVIASTQSLFKAQDVAVMYRTKPADLLQLVITFLLTVFLGIQSGILLSVGFSLILLIYRSFQPRVTVLGRLPGTDVFVDAKRYPQTRGVRGIVVIRIDGELNFGNTKLVAKALFDVLAAVRMRRVAVHGTVDVDAFGQPIRKLSNLEDKLDTQGGDVDGGSDESVAGSNPEDGKTALSDLGDDASGEKDAKRVRGDRSVVSEIARTKSLTFRKDWLRRAAAAGEPEWKLEYRYREMRRVGDRDWQRSDVSVDDDAVRLAAAIATASNARNRMRAASAAARRPRNMTDEDDVSAGLASPLPVDHDTNRADRTVSMDASAFARGEAWSESEDGGSGRGREEGDVDTGLVEVKFRSESAAAAVQSPFSAPPLRPPPQTPRIEAAPTTHPPLAQSPSSDDATIPSAEDFVLDPHIAEDLPPSPNGDPWTQDPLLLRAMVIDGSRVTAIDTSACQELRAAVMTYRKLGLDLLFAAFPGPVRDTMDRFGILPEQDDGSTTNASFLTVTAAIEAVLQRTPLWRAGTDARGTYLDKVLPETQQPISMPSQALPPPPTPPTPGEDGDEKEDEEKVEGKESIGSGSPLEEIDDVDATDIPTPSSKVRCGAGCGLCGVGGSLSRGEELWTVNMSATVLSACNTSVVVGKFSNIGELSELSALDGKLHWTTPAHQEEFMESPTIFSDWVCVGAKYGKSLLCVDRETGVITRRFHLHSKGNRSPIRLADGLVVLSSDDWNLIGTPIGTMTILDLHMQSNSPQVGPSRPKPHLLAPLLGGIGGFIAVVVVSAYLWRKKQPDDSEEALLADPEG